MMPGPAGLNEDQQAAAVQAAIWYFTDGYVVDTSQTIFARWPRWWPLPRRTVLFWSPAFRG